MFKANGQETLFVVCEYLGKKPKEPHQLTHNYKKINTDFYRVTVQNLSDQDVRIVGVRYRMANGPTKPIPDATSKSIKAAWGTDVIPAKETVVQENAFVWSKSRVNRLIKNYTFVTTDGNGKEVKFSGQLDLFFRQ